MPPDTVQDRRLTDLAAQRAVYDRSLGQAVRQVAAVSAGVDGVRRVSLFGSAARGRRDRFTDLGVPVIWGTGMPDRLFLRRIRSEEVLLYEKKPA